MKKFNELSNRPARHKGYTAKTHAIEVDGQWVGICKFSHTPSVNPENFKQKMTPYTAEGRKLYRIQSIKRLPLARPPLYDNNTDLFRLAKANSKSKNIKKRKYNFEYYMNREYAWNRDLGKCKIWELDILHFRLAYTSRLPNLPLDKINKVKNLASMHNRCHSILHGMEAHLDTKINKNIERYRAKLNKQAEQVN